MIHIPISENRVAQFAARFEPHGDGYLYYGDSRLGGLPLSAAERDRYVAHFAKVLRAGSRLMVGWVLCAAIGLVVAAEGYGRQTQDWQRAVIFLLPVPWVLWTWRRSTAIVLEDIGRRVAVMPPQSVKAGVRSRVTAFPLEIPVMMIGIGALLLVQQWRYGTALTDVGGDQLGVGVIIFGAWILWIKRR